ncbi:hypothetical protein TPY_2358 [Sulfobacillus acidophilus TPY]|nr:hypothetical protein TPY_2358 [Sulfobacillus acidophilus TPY]
MLRQPVGSSHGGVLHEAFWVSFPNKFFPNHLTPANRTVYINNVHKISFVRNLFCEYR